MNYTREQVAESRRSAAGLCTEFREQAPGQNIGMTSPTRFIKRLVSEQAPREAVIRQDLATRRYLVTFYRFGVRQAEMDASTADEKEAVRWGREFVQTPHEGHG